jgi:hypothetical protein
MDVLSPFLRNECEVLPGKHHVGSGSKVIDVAESDVYWLTGTNTGSLYQRDTR